MLTTLQMRQEPNSELVVHFYHSVCHITLNSITCATLLIEVYSTCFIWGVEDEDI